MSDTLEIKIFDVSELSEPQVTRLESLLDELDIAAKERQAYLNIGRRAAFKHFLDNPDTVDREHDLMKIYNAFPKERLKVFLEEVLETTFGEENENILSKLEGFSFQQKIEIFVSAGISYADFIDKSKDRAYWSKLDKIYEAILNEYPNILNNIHDIKGALMLGQAKKDQKSPLHDPWQLPKNPLAVEIKQLLATAYPDDDIEHLEIVTADISGALHMPSMSLDTIVLGPPCTFHNFSLSDIGFFVLAHENQHRRQTRLADKLEKDELEKGTAEYYQARIYYSQFKGGYLTTITAENKIQKFARYIDYEEQPIERQADLVAKVACTIGNPKGLSLLNTNSVLYRSFSRVAQPIDFVMHNTQRVYNGLKSLGSSAPAP